MKFYLILRKLRGVNQCQAVRSSVHRKRRRARVRLPPGAGEAKGQGGNTEGLGDEWERKGKKVLEGQEQKGR